MSVRNFEEARGETSSDSQLRGEEQVGGLFVTGEVVTRHLYPVDKILNRRFRDGQVEYLLAWHGFGPEDYTWEPAENVTSRELIDEFEEEHSLCSIEAIPTEENEVESSPQNANKMNNAQKMANGFDLGLEPQQIIGVLKTTSGELIFRIKWIGIDETTLVPARVVNSKWPQGIISFYEYRLAWPTPEPMQQISEQNLI